MFDDEVKRVMIRKLYILRINEIIRGSPSVVSSEQWVGLLQLTMYLRKGAFERNLRSPLGNSKNTKILHNGRSTIA